MLGRIRSSNRNVYFKPNRRPHRQKYKKMSGTITIIVIMVAIVCLSKFAIIEGQRKESHKKFMRNMKNFDKKGYVESSKRNK